MTVNHWVAGSSPAGGATGGVAEWLNAPVLKTGIGESLSRVRIPLPPPYIHAPVAQLDRAIDYESIGQEFESSQAHQ